MVKLYIVRDINIFNLDYKCIFFIFVVDWWSYFWFFYVVVGGFFCE